MAAIATDTKEDRVILQSEALCTFAPLDIRKPKYFTTSIGVTKKGNLVYLSFSPLRDDGKKVRDIGGVREISFGVKLPEEYRPNTLVSRGLRWEVRDAKTGASRMAFCRLNIAPDGTIKTQNMRDATRFAKGQFESATINFNIVADPDKLSMFEAIKTIQACGKEIKEFQIQVRDLRKELDEMRAEIKELRDKPA